MKNLIPLQFQRMMLEAMSTPDLYDIISRKNQSFRLLAIMGIKPTEDNLVECKACLKECYDLVRQVFLERTGAEASVYQNAAINAWLKTWKKTNNLPFIETKIDKQYMLRQLERALRDPLASEDHKLRCCLLIHKLYPMEQNQFPAILEFILSKNSERSRSHYLKIFAGELSDEDLEKHLKKFINQLQTPAAPSNSNEAMVLSYLTRQDSVESPLALLHYSKEPDNKKNFVETLIPKKTEELTLQNILKIIMAFPEPLKSFKDPKYSVISEEMMKQLTPWIDDALNFTLSLPENTNVDSRVRQLYILGRLSCSLTTDAQKAKVFNFLMTEMDDETLVRVVDNNKRRLICAEAFFAACELADFLTDKGQLEQLQTKLISKWMKVVPYPMEIFKFSTALFTIAQSLSSAQNTEAILETIMAYTNDDTNRFNEADLIRFFPALNTEKQQNTLIDLALSKINNQSRGAKARSIQFLANHISPHLKTEKQKKAVLEIMINNLSIADFRSQMNPRSCCFQALAHLLSDEQKKQIFECALKEIKPKNIYLNEVLAPGLVCILTTQEQRTSLFNALFKLLNDPSPHTISVAAVTMISLSPYLNKDQLKAIRTIPLKNDFEILSLWLVIQTLLHVKKLNTQFDAEDAAELARQQTDSNGVTKPLARSWDEASKAQGSSDDSLEQDHKKTKMSHD